MEAFADKLKRLREIIHDCTLCPRRCHVDRLADQIGACRIGAKAVVASWGPHFGEEPVLVGSGGSGTVFFAGCNLDCVFCQNFDISHSCAGRSVDAVRIARLSMELQSRGCANVNFVTPTHVAHAVAEAIVLAREGGLVVPVVYNSGGYESVETLRLLEGLIEIYMPDFKWADPEAGRKYSGVDDYPKVAAAALREMYRQVGPLELDAGGRAIRGVLVRHLVMPGDLARSRQVIDIIAANAPGCAINIMGQYRPAHRATEFIELMRRPRQETIESLRRYAVGAGLVRDD